MSAIECMSDPAGYMQAKAEEKAAAVAAAKAQELAKSKGLDGAADLVAAVSEE